jgi:hypothetical protein
MSDLWTDERLAAAPRDAAYAINTELTARIE